MTREREEGFMRRMKGAMLKHMHGMMTCREFEDFIVRYLDGDLPKAQVKVFEWHMRLCRECREYLAAYKRSMEVSQAVLGEPDEPVPSDMPEDLITAILDAKKQS